MHCLDRLPPSTFVFVVTVIALCLALGFILYQIRKRRLEQEHEQVVAQARYNRFLELLRDVKWNLLHRNCW